MMQEIFQRGPIHCPVTNNPTLVSYTGGIYEDKEGWDQKPTNHAISVVGWGVENGVKYWVV